MGKPHRGKGVRELFAHGRGECPVCKRYNVKILYEVDAGEQKFKICKTCKAAVKHGKKSLPVTVTAKAEEPQAAQAVSELEAGKTVTETAETSDAVEKTEE